MNVTIKIASEITEGKRGVLWNEELSHHIREDELRETLKEARRAAWKTSEARGVNMGMDLFGLLNGSGRKLETTLREVYHTGEPLHIALDIPFEFDALPFELLYAPPLAGETESAQSSPRRKKRKGKK